LKAVSDLPSARNNKYIQRFVGAGNIYGGNKKATKIFSRESWKEWIGGFSQEWIGLASAGMSHHVL